MVKNLKDLIVIKLENCFLLIKSYNTKWLELFIKERFIIQKLIGTELNRLNIPEGLTNRDHNQNLSFTTLL